MLVCNVHNVHLRSDVKLSREAGVFQHNGGSIQEPHLAPRYDSAVIYGGFQGAAFKIIFLK